MAAVTVAGAALLSLGSLMVLPLMLCSSPS